MTHRVWRFFCCSPNADEVDADDLTPSLSLNIRMVS
jgi:hypothetical protein